MSVKERSGGVSKTDSPPTVHLSEEVSNGGTKPGSGQVDSSGAGVTLGWLLHFKAVNSRAEINICLNGAFK